MGGARKAIWHPMTQHKIFPEMTHIDHAQGAYLHTKDGRKILDGISSWWVNTHGHCHPKIVSAVQEQAAKLEQVIFAGFTHDPAEKLADKLLGCTRTHLGQGLDHVFFSDSGSTAIEVALKMAIGYFAQTSGRRSKIVALENGYHGDTFGTMSTGARCVFNEIYAPYLFDSFHLPLPSAGKEAETLAAFEKILSDHKDDVAALILEPLVQGAAGMQIYSPEVLRGLYDLCRTHGVLLIADEVMTGFGRLGSMFACSQAGIVPDFLCLSKGITGGFLPMGATLCGSKIYDAFYDDSRARQFFHSTSFTGNALACAAALANLEIWEGGGVEADLKRIEEAHMCAVREFDSVPNIKNARVKGTILALEIEDPNPGYLSDLGPSLYSFFLQHDILLRPIGNCIYVLPPYCTDDKDLRRIYDAIILAAEKVRTGDFPAKV